MIAGVRASRPTGTSFCGRRSLLGMTDSTKLTDGLTSTKIHGLSGHRGSAVSCRTLHRYATELQFAWEPAANPAVGPDRYEAMRRPPSISHETLSRGCAALRTDQPL